MKRHLSLSCRSSATRVEANAMTTQHYPDVGCVRVVKLLSAGFLTVGEKIRLADINEAGGPLSAVGRRAALVLQNGELSELPFIRSR